MKGAYHSYLWRLDFFVHVRMKYILVFILLAFTGTSLNAQPKALGLRLEGYTYPYPVHYMNTEVQHKRISIAYMDVRPVYSNGKTVLLLHGKNFPAAYWKGVIGTLVSKGYRVIAPDALGFGKSSKPVIQYSFSLLAMLDRQLLDSLGINRVSVIGHSTGGMLAARFALSYPERVSKLVLEDPIGLEDWRAKGVPYRKVDEWYREERNATYDKIVNYQKGYYPEWKEQYRQWADVQYGPLKSKDAATYAMVSALTYDMIFTQPVIHEFGNISVPVLLMVGKEDHTKIARGASKQLTEELGHVKDLAKDAAHEIPDCKLIEYDDVGHIPHLQIPERFYTDVLKFLAK